MKNKLCKPVLLLASPNDETTNGIFMKNRNWYHIHIISLDPDEKIDNTYGEKFNNGDFIYYNVHNEECVFVKTKYNICNGNFRSENCFKIIASIDKSLNLPQPSPEYIQQFMEEYNAGEVKDVNVEYIYIPGGRRVRNFENGYYLPGFGVQLKLTNNQITIHPVIECEHPFKSLHWVGNTVFCNKCKTTLRK